jgi:hypothetical protein
LCHIHVNKSVWKQAKEVTKKRRNLAMNISIRLRARPFRKPSNYAESLRSKKLPTSFLPGNRNAAARQFTRAARAEPPDCRNSFCALSQMKQIVGRTIERTNSINE